MGKRTLVIGLITLGIWIMAPACANDQSAAKEEACKKAKGQPIRDTMTGKYLYCAYR